MVSEVKKVLYIEDNRDTAEVVQIIIKTLGHNVDLAFNGKDGMEKIKNKTYDLIIFDIMLPDVSGLKLFDIARVQRKDYPTKFAFLSITYIPKEKREKLRKQGVSDFIPKPFEKDDLINRVKTILSEK